MRLYRLGELAGFDSMTVFHALAYLNEEALVIVSPQEPIASLGYFQDVSTSINMEYCQKNNIGIMRREIGGGTTLLDRNQIFYQVILNKNNKHLPKDTLALYRQFTQPVMDTYEELGIAVKYKEVNDILTKDGRKISGEGGANIGDSVVFVGGLLLDFDHELMSNIFPAESDEYRRKLLKVLRENIATIKGELGYIPLRLEIEGKLIKHFSKIFGFLEPANVPNEVWAKAKELEKQYTSPSFINKKSKEQRGVKIASGINTYEKSFKAVGGTINTMFEVKEGVLNKPNIYGDFTFLPKEKLIELEANLHLVAYDAKSINKKINEFFSKHDVDCPGVTIEDFTKAFFS